MPGRPRRQAQTTWGDRGRGEEYLPVTVTDACSRASAGTNGWETSPPAHAGPVVSQAGDRMPNPSTSSPWRRDIRARARERPCHRLSALERDVADAPRDDEATAFTSAHSALAAVCRGSRTVAARDRDPGRQAGGCPVRRGTWWWRFGWSGCGRERSGRVGGGRGSG